MWHDIAKCVLWSKWNIRLFIRMSAQHQCRPLSVLVMVWNIAAKQIDNGETKIHKHINYNLPQNTRTEPLESRIS